MKKKVEDRESRIEDRHWSRIPMVEFLFFKQGGRIG